MLLDCPQCQQRYIRPRQLPCGFSLCSFCIKVATVESSDEFKCVSCGQIHLVPENGFPIDLNLTDELNRKPTTPTDINFFKSILDQIKLKLTQAEFDPKMGDLIIKEYCSELRRQVQLAKDLEIEELHKLSEKMITQIDCFEQNKLDHYYYYSNNVVDKFKFNFSAQLEEMREKLSKCNENLAQSEISFQLLEDLQMKLKNEKNRLDSILFTKSIKRMDKKTTGEHFIYIFFTRMMKSKG